MPFSLPHSWRRQCIYKQSGHVHLGRSISSLRHSGLGKFTMEHETNSYLDLTKRKGQLLVVGGKLASLTGNALEDVLDERVHDGHSLLADAGVGVDLLEHLVDVGGVGFGVLLVALLLAVGGGLDGLGRCGLGGCFGHDGNEREEVVSKG